MHTPETPPPCAADEKVARALHDYALSFPETTLEFPWGHSAYKVNKKIFLTLGCDADGLRLSLKLPESNLEALLLPFTEPTGYGLGKSGWVSARFEPKTKIPLVTLTDWVLESYRAVAPKQALELLDGDASTAPSSLKNMSAKRAPSKRSISSPKKKSSR
jgi:predicted DNA-binding protein (MmcQ/YjbR family)